MFGKFTSRKFRISVIQKLMKLMICNIKYIVFELFSLSICQKDSSFNGIRIINLNVTNNTKYNCSILSIMQISLIMQFNVFPL